MSQMTDLITMLLVLGAGYYAYKEGMLDDLANQLKAVDLSGGGGGEAAPAPTDAAPAPAEGGGESAPTEGDGGAEPAAAGGACDCKCMPMDSDPNRFKIETAAGEDCYNHVYPASMAECETALKEVCAKRGGGGAAPASEPPADSGGGGDDKAADSGGGEDKGGGGKDYKKKKSNYARSCTDYTPMNWG